MESKSTYYDAFTAIMKITLRDGNVSEEESTFLQVFGKKLGITSSEYIEIKKNYIEFDIIAPYTYKQRYESLYKVLEIVYNDNTMHGENRIKWLERFAIAIGFDPSNVKYIIAKSIDLFDAGSDFDTYKEGLDNLST